MTVLTLDETLIETEWNEKRFPREQIKLRIEKQCIAGDAVSHDWKTRRLRKRRSYLHPLYQTTRISIIIITCNTFPAHTVIITASFWLRSTFGTRGCVKSPRLW